MSAKGKVNLFTQAIMVLIPFVDLFAAYRVRRARLFFLIVWVPAITLHMLSPPLFSYDEYYTDDDDEWYECLEHNDFEFCDQEFGLYGDCENNWALVLLYDTCDPPELQMFQVILFIAAHVLAIYLIIHWSKQWNEQFS